MHKIVMIEEINKFQFLAIQDNNNIQLDIYPRRWVYDNKKIKDLQKEIEVNRYLDHKYIQKIIQYDQNDRFIYFIKEPVKITLKDRLTLEHLNQDQVCKLLQQIIEVFIYLNTKNYKINLEIENILFDQNDDLKLGNLQNIMSSSHQINCENLAKLIYRCLYQMDYKIYPRIIDDKLTMKPVLIFWPNNPVSLDFRVFLQELANGDIAIDDLLKLQ